MYSIAINKELLPYEFYISLSNEQYKMQIDYNDTGDLFTVSLWKNETCLCVGEPIIYGVPLFGDLANREGFPQITITPIDESGERHAVTYDNLSTTVVLKVTGGEYDE